MDKVETNHPLVRKTPKAAGYELYCLEDFEIKSGDKKVIETGVKMNIPSNYYAKIHGKSRHIKDSIIVLAGVIDASYTGTIKVALYNGGCKTFKADKSTSIAQLILQRYETFDNEVIECPADFEHTGFGSTGN